MRHVLSALALLLVTTATASAKPAAAPVALDRMLDVSSLPLARQRAQTIVLPDVSKPGATIELRVTRTVTPTLRGERRCPNRAAR